MNSFINRYTLVASFILSIISILILQNLVLGIFLSIFLIASQVYERNFIISCVIISFLIFSSDIESSYRITINIILTCILLYYFIKDKGLKINAYKKVPDFILNYILITLFIMLLSSLFSQAILVGLEQAIRQIFFFFIVYFIYNLISFKDIERLLLTLIVVGMVLSLAILYQFILSGFSFSWFLNFSGTRFGGIISNVNAAGGILAITIPLGLLLYLLNREHNCYKLINIVLILIMFLGLLLTNSRASMGAVFLSIFFILFVLYPSLRKYLLLIPLSIIFIFILVPVLNNFAYYYFRLGNFEANREYFWQTALYVFKDHWILGTGPAQFAANIYNSIPYMIGSFAEYQIHGLLLEGAGSGHAHNFYLFFASELGIPGLFLSLSFPIICGYLIIKCIKLSKNYNRRIYIISISLAGITIGLFVRSFFESTGLITYGWISRDLPFWLILIVLIIIFNHLNKIKLAHAE